MSRIANSLDNGYKGTEDGIFDRAEEYAVSILEQRVEEILSSPFGCAFFANAGEFGYEPGDLANPAVSLTLAAQAVIYVEKWNADHEGDVERALALAPVIRPLVEATLGNDGTAWWYEPLAPDRQVRIRREFSTSGNTNRERGRRILKRCWKPNAVSLPGMSWAAATTTTAQFSERRRRFATMAAHLPSLLSRYNA